MQLKIRTSETPVPPVGDAPLSEQVKAMDTILDADKPAAEEPKVEIEIAKAGVALRRIKGAYVIGQFDSLKVCQEWIQKNECDPTLFEVKDATGAWVNFDSVDLTK